MPSRRIERVNELLRREISRLVLARQHPDMGFITFTGVQTTDDLMEAKVFYSILGPDEDKRRSARALEDMRREITLSMRRLESLKHIPHLHFVVDDTPARAARVFEIMETIRHDESGPPGDTPRA
jgi:ribosome-binding factor A